MYNPFKEQTGDCSNDIDLIARSLKGDTGALEEIILRHQSWIYNIALTMTGDVHGAEDITQEVLIKVITKLSTYDSHKAAFRTWLYRIVVNHIVNLKYNQKEKFFSEIVLSYNHGEHIDLHPDTRKSFRPGHALIAEETKTSCVLCILLCLSRMERIIFILGVLFDVTDRIGSEICGISRGNFRKILSRSRKKVFNFFDSNCSLLHENNPCTCAKQTDFLIRAGMIDIRDLAMNRDSFGAIQEVLGDSVRDLESSYYEFLALFKGQPFFKGPDTVQWLRNLLSRTDIKSLFAMN
jgi:RNA polymerase sigma factor (sigma-70 family)